MSTDHHFVWWLQTAIIILIGWWMSPNRFGIAAIFALLAFDIAVNNGVPAWRDDPWGDAYDIASLTYVALCWATKGQA